MGSSIHQTVSPNGFKPERKISVEKVRDASTFVCIKGNPCKIVHMSMSPAAKQQFIAIDIFNGKVFKATFPLDGDCLVPVVTLSDYLLVDISEQDSHVTLLNDKGHIKWDMKLPTHQDFLSPVSRYDIAGILSVVFGCSALHPKIWRLPLSWIKVGLMEGKDVFLSVASAMGKEQIVASKIKNPK